ncbi:hypothetical protein [Candidatus Nitrosotenuis cloacae]|uniref:hypothetical protein n=1 Tax=Candidatus Nitrosotenuis cloacae TaxID=1603555 RepID=UPI00228076E6|nr:hypothetical protein [Candidatus Nitrosotenuis cloacae]
MLGNPISKITNQQQDLADFQIDYHQAIQCWHNVQILKSRKLGATETGITSIALNCFDRYSGHDVLFTAGNELGIATETLVRFYEFFKDRQHSDGYYAFKHLKPEYVEPLTTGEIDWEYAMNRADKLTESHFIKRKVFGQKPMIEFIDGTRCFAWAVVRQEKAQSFRGTDDLICIFFTEAAHTGLKADQSVMNALSPNLAQRDDADFILESTGNGKRGFFYNYWMNTMKSLSKNLKMPLLNDNHQILVDKLHDLWREQMMTKKKTISFPVDWFPLMYDYKIGLKHNILSQKYIEKEKRNPKLDFLQEYACKFTSTYTSAIDTSNLKFVPDILLKQRKIPKDLRELVGEKSVQY